MGKAEHVASKLLRRMERTVEDAKIHATQIQDQVAGGNLPPDGPDGSGYPPEAHASTHESGGSDELDLGSLAGTLTLGQLLDSFLPASKLSFDPATQAELDTHAATIASTSVLGHVKVGTGLAIDGS